MKELKCSVFKWKITEEEVKDRIESTIRKYYEAQNDHFRSIDEDHGNILSDEELNEEVRIASFYINELAPGIAYDTSYHGRGAYRLEVLIEVIQALDTSMYNVSRGRAYDDDQG